jgi:hypothetical protein
LTMQPPVGGRPWQVWADDDDANATAPSVSIDANKAGPRLEPQ